MKILIKIVFLIFIVSLSFTITEISSRIFLSYNVPIHKRINFELKYKEVNNYQILEPFQSLFKVTRGEIIQDSLFYYINRYGQNGTDFDFKKKDGELRIVFMGGSHIFDQGFHHFKGGPFTELIMTKFKQENIRIINAGIPGNNLSDIFNRLKHDILNFEPDIVIINSIWNDLKVINRYNERKIWVKKSNSIDKNPIIHSMNKYDDYLGWSSVYRKVRDYYWMKKFRINFNSQITEQINNINREEYQGDVRLGLLNHYVKYLNKSIQLLKENNILPILAIEERLINSNNSKDEKNKIQYRMVNLDKHDELVSLYEKCDSVLYEISKKHDITLFDINKEMPKNLKYFTDHVHTTELGSRFMAEEYFKRLKPIVENRF